LDFSWFFLHLTAFIFLLGDGATLAAVLVALGLFKLTLAPTTVTRQVL
jgi:hypothetical protein